MNLAPIKFDEGYKVLREDRISFTLHCPHCPYYSVTLTEYMSILHTMREHAANAHGLTLPRVEEEIVMVEARHGVYQS